jgi:AraC family transcriptional activator of pobA
MSAVKYISAPVLQSELLSPATQFTVSSIDNGKCSLSSYNRRNFFKITLVTGGESHLLYANKDFKISGPALVFTSPDVPYSWEVIGGVEELNGYCCVFTDAFVISPGSRERLQDVAIYKAGGNPVFMLDAVQATYIMTLFTQMDREMEGDYKHKFEVISSHINLLIHEALKMQPATNYAVPANASARITKLFLSQLEKQFPVDLPHNILQFKRASDFARLLNVHANHLNAAVQEVTGKSTSTHINERILNEARSLITHTDWSIAEIAFSLGFDYVSYFNRFFKKHTGLTPVAFRKAY